jgi:hypothetical protein
MKDNDFKKDSMKPTALKPLIGRLVFVWASCFVLVTFDFVASPGWDAPTTGLIVPGKETDL